MKVLLLHLSDIHITDDHNPVLQRVKAISDVVISRALDAQACILMISGDIAFSGTELQYLQAADLIDQLKARLVSKLDKVSSVHVVIVPGNHDCNFEHADGIRNLLIEQMNGSLAVDDEVITRCLQVQENYFEFMRYLGDEQLVRLPTADNSIESKHRLYYEYSVRLGEQAILVRCYNTAWVSKKHEDPGTMVYPVSVAEGKKDNHALVIS